MGIPTRLLPTTDMIYCIILKRERESEENESIVATANHVGYELGGSSKMSTTQK
jgi:hypothetical protein